MTEEAIDLKETKGGIWKGFVEGNLGQKFNENKTSKIKKKCNTSRLTIITKMEQSLGVLISNSITVYRYIAFLPHLNS